MIVLDYKDRRPLYEQVAERFKELIIRGVLPADTQMPSVRSQAIALSINPNTIQRAYSQLEQQGYIYTTKGRGSFVADTGQLLDQQKAGWSEEFLRMAAEGDSLGSTREEMNTLTAQAEKMADIHLKSSGQETERGNKD